MDGSILIVGDDNFQAALFNSIEQLGTFTVEAVSSTTEAVPIVQAQQPDLLILQASQAGSLELCSQIKAQNRIAWIYCIVCSGVSASGAYNGAISLNPGLDDIMALEAGADSFLHCDTMMPESPVNDHWDASFEAVQREWSGYVGGTGPLSVESKKNTTVPESSARFLSALDQRRLYAHIWAGMRRVRNHRELVRTNDLLSAIALSDPLTELNNRRALEWELPRQVQNARSRNMPMSLIMLDVDFFKTINDNHGHLIGDRALQLISARLKHNLRFCDTPFRYGGEEFVIILNDTDADEAELVAQRLCRLIAAQPFAVGDSLDLSITISLGAATLQPHDDDRGNSLLKRADDNLLTAKSHGRNQVVVSS
jgi:two-component system cell cycle response regulator